MKHHPLHHLKTKLSTPEFVKILLLRAVGNFLILFSLFLLIKTYYQPIREEIRYFVERRFQKTYIVATTKEEYEAEIKARQQISQGALAKLLKVTQNEMLIPKDPQFSIVVPKMGANSNIIANVNSADDKEYLDVLKRGVAHAQGTAFPGENGHIFLFAHSTDTIWNVGTYNAIFYLLYKLDTGDEINLFYKGRRYVYRVVGKEIVNPDKVEYLTRKTNNEFLTLQTCWPPGTTLQRLLVFAEPAYRIPMP